MISVLPASASFRQFRIFGERIKEGGVLVGRSVYHGDFASRGMTEAYACKTWKRITDVSTDVKDVLKQVEQDGIMAGKGEVVAVETVVAAIPTMFDDLLLNLKEHDHRILESAIV